jgi:5-methylcytosine-specific restriction endonuclease McrA
MADLSLSKLDLLASKKSTQNPTPPPAPAFQTTQDTTSKTRGRYIPAGLRRHVWNRDQGCCQYVSKQTGKKCGSQYGLEIHHRHAFAKGGEHTAENLVLHCFAHNQFEAVQEFGERVFYRH